MSARLAWTSRPNGVTRCNLRDSRSAREGWALTSAEYRRAVWQLDYRPAFWRRR